MPNKNAKYTYRYRILSQRVLQVKTTGVCSMGEERRFAETKCVGSVSKGYDPYDFRPDSVPVGKELVMLKPGTHFEQVPLETVRKIIKEQMQREARTSDAIEEERPETAFAAMEEPSMAELAGFLTGSDRNDS